MLRTSADPRATPCLNFVGVNWVKNRRNAVSIACSSYPNRRVGFSAAGTQAVIDRFGRKPGASDLHDSKGVIANSKCFGALAFVAEIRRHLRYRNPDLYCSCPWEQYAAGEWRFNLCDVGV